MPESVVFDESALLSGSALRLLREGRLGADAVVVPRAVVDDLQGKASRNIEAGIAGLRALADLRRQCESSGVEFYVHEGGIADPGKAAIEAARELGAILHTADRSVHLAAEALGVKSSCDPGIGPGVGRLAIERYFDGETMSVHLKEGTPPLAKKGRPGDFRLEIVGESEVRRDELEDIVNEILQAARTSADSFVELEMSGATVVQLGQYRIAIARPPFSDGLEVTAVRPLVRLSISDYDVSDKLLSRLRDRAEGILIAGPPGSGKSTLAASLAEFYRSMGRIVKTLESPRDLQVGPEVTQYAPLEGDFARTAEVLLLVRPDYTIFDEMRKTRDFEVYVDLRLAGVGMVGVVHASSPIDAVQRLIGRVELGMIPHVVDTILFVRAGRIERVLDLSLTVKVPTGMSEEDLARPVVEVRDFETSDLLYEIYTFGEENVVVPVGGVRRG
ncbi:MAG: ATPase, T2SS/T4P/T4SS family, partial [Conexivisphaera sp.]